ncbi:MAG TPA: GNAT family N-acetyltransferase [Candidatus Limnocylindrales bacterium]|nr:GNAT family N-acetyltransferase [Candidatus Limnocylindrales bacterium]
MVRTSDPSALKRASAGSYRSTDGRFTVEQASGRWLVLDGEQLDELGLPLTRGPFSTLDAARAAIAEAREGPAPMSQLPGRMATLRREGRAAVPSGASRHPGRPAARDQRLPRSETAAAPPAARSAGSAASAAAVSAPPRAEIRTYRAGEGAALRGFWSTVGFRSLGDDDESLDRLAERNPGLVVVGSVGEAIVATALGAWDGRRGWIYHVAVAEELRRTGLGRRIIHEVERRLRALGCPKVNVIVGDDNEGAARFWAAMGYSSPPARQYGKEL